MTKSQVIALLLSATVKATRFNQLLPLLSSKMPGAFAHHNRSGYSATGLKTLEYDIMQSYGISKRDLRAAKSESPKAEGTAETKQSDHIITKENVFQLAPEEVKKELKLRERYPFLNDPTTPHIGKFYQLVGINGTAYNQMVEARKALFEKTVFSEEAAGDPETVPMTKEEIFELAQKAVENYELNIQGTEELDYFLKENEILGNHEIFKDEALARKVATLKPAQLASKNSNLKNYINKNLVKLENSTDEAAKAKTTAKIRDWEAELALVQQRLEVPQEKRYVSKLKPVASSEEEE